MRNRGFLLLTCAAAAVAACAGTSPARAQVAGFPDVPKNHWAAQSVAKLAAGGVITSASAAPFGAMSAGAQKVPAGSKPAYDGNRPVTRYELAVTLYRFVQYIEHADKMKKGKTNAAIAPMDGAAAVKRLIADGYLPKNTPLATEGGKAVTANQLADAMAQVVAKSREKTTPITPGSVRTTPIEKPANAPGT